jgi:hypothetical protein
MRIGVVGVGKIGSLYSSYLRNAGHATLHVDPKIGTMSHGYSDILEIEKDVAESIDAWIISSPTATHLGVLDRVLHQNPRARVLIEKPVCGPSELDELAALTRRHPASRIRVNDVYGHSPAIGKLASAVQRLSADREIQKITIELTKNRIADDFAGRSVDEQYGDIGYEWFHVLSILKAVLRPTQHRDYLESDLEYCRITPEIREHLRAPGLPELELYSSARGRIAFSEHAAFAFHARAAQSEIASRRIPIGSELRYRFADVEVEGGARATLIFEHGFGRCRNYKNRHILYVRTHGEVHAETIRVNQLERGLLLQLGKLMRSGEGARTLYFAEHRRMARLRSAIYHRRGVSVTRPAEGSRV